MTTRFENTVSLGGLIGNGITVVAMIGSGLYIFATRSVQTEAAIQELASVKASVQRLATVESVESLRADMLQGFKALAMVPDLRAEATQAERRIATIEGRVQSHDDRLALHASQLASEQATLDALQRVRAK